MAFHKCEEAYLEVLHISQCLWKFGALLSEYASIFSIVYWAFTLDITSSFLGGETERHSFAMDTRTANKMWIITFLINGGKFSILKLNKSKAGLRAYFILVIFRNNDWIFIQKGCIAIQFQNMWWRLPGEWQFLQQWDGILGLILFNRNGVMYHLCKSFWALSQWSIQAEDLWLYLIASCHWDIENSFCNSCSHFSILGSLDCK